MMKKLKLFLFIFLAGLVSCANQTKPVNPWVGLWKISQKSFEDARTGPMFVELKDDGSYKTGYFKDGRFTTVIARGKWTIKNGRFIDTKAIGVVTASLEKIGKGRVRLFTDRGEEIFLIKSE